MYLLLLNNGKDEQGNQFLSKRIISILYEPVHLYTIYLNVKNFKNGDDKLFNSTLFENYIFGVIVNHYCTGFYNTINSNPLDNSSNQFTEIGANSSSTNLIKNQAIYISSFNTNYFSITFTNQTIDESNKYTFAGIERANQICSVLTRSSNIVVQKESALAALYISGSVLQGN